VWECGDGQTDTQPPVTNVHFASSTTHAKYNKTRMWANAQPDGREEEEQTTA